MRPIEGEKRFNVLCKQLIWNLLVIGTVLFFAVGCGQVVPGEEGTIGVLDHDLFKSSVQPILDNRSCSNAGCHFRDKNDPNVGGPGGSLRLFECDNATCTSDELQSNHDSTAGMANLANPIDSKLLGKPLALSIGGLQHLGGEIFLSMTDGDYLTILAWIESPL